MKELLPDRTLVHFFDSVLGYSQKGLHRVCRAIQETEHSFVLSCNMRADLLTPELIRSLRRAGFAELRMGVESGDQALLDRNNRTLAVDRFADIMRMIRDQSDLYITLYSVTGLPGTTVRSQQMILPDDLIECLRTQPCGKRRFFLFLLFAHVFKQIHIFCGSLSLS